MVVFLAPVEPVGLLAMLLVAVPHRPLALVTVRALTAAFVRLALGPAVLAWAEAPLAEPAWAEVVMVLALPAGRASRRKIHGTWDTARSDPCLPTDIPPTDHNASIRLLSNLPFDFAAV